MHLTLSCRKNVLTARGEILGVVARSPWPREHASVQYTSSGSPCDSINSNATCLRKSVAVGATKRIACRKSGSRGVAGGEDAKWQAVREQAISISELDETTSYLQRRTSRIRQREFTAVRRHMVVVTVAPPPPGRRGCDYAMVQKKNVRLRYDVPDMHRQECICKAVVSSKTDKTAKKIISPAGNRTPASCE
jgi:hypothetical protein